MEEKKISQPAVPSENEEEALNRASEIRREKLQKLQAVARTPMKKSIRDDADSRAQE